MIDDQTYKKELTLQIRFFKHVCVPNVCDDKPEAKTTQEKFTVS